MSSSSWEYVRAKVLTSKILRQVLEKLELYEVEVADSSYTLRIKDHKGLKKGVAKSRYRIAEELGKKYPSVIRALRILKDHDLTLERKKGKAVTYVWTLKAVILFPEMATVDNLSGFYQAIFGDPDEFRDYWSSLLGLSKEEAKSLLDFLCWNSVDFISWIRDDIFLPYDEGDEEGLPDPNDTEYWRKMAIVYLLKEYFLYISEDPEGYFDDLKKNLASYAHKEIPMCIKAFDKLRRFGSRWLEEGSFASKKEAPVA